MPPEPGGAAADAAPPGAPRAVAPGGIAAGAAPAAPPGAAPPGAPAAVAPGGIAIAGPRQGRAMGYMKAEREGRVKNAGL